jgi:hypothetical protein
MGMEWNRMRIFIKHSASELNWKAMNDNGFKMDKIYNISIFI